MALRIVTKKRFQNKVRKLNEYLISNWYESVADDFALKLISTIVLISEQPQVGSAVKGFNGIRTILITEHNRLYYRIEKNTLVIINLIDTRRNPKTNPFKKQ
jgi:plasmid stabilization system protein ParE